MRSDMHYNRRRRICENMRNIFTLWIKTIS